MSLRARKNVGVIGLGIIGRRVADNLREHGFHVFVWNRTPRAVPNFVGSPAEVAEICDFIQIFVSDDEALLQMVQKISRNLGPNHVVMAHCTVSPETMRAAAEQVASRGARLLDAPFTGSKTAAENGQLVYYIGGEETALQLARPILAASSKEIIPIGKVGDATVVKVATNMVTAASVQSVAEALALIVRTGLPVEKFAEAMRNNASNSPTLDMKLPMMLDGNFEPHFSVKHMLKDIVIATRLARGHGLELGATNASRHGLDLEVRRGRGDEDYSALVRQYFPSGGSLKRDAKMANGEEEQPRLAGLEEKTDADETLGDEKIAEEIASVPSVVNAAKVEHEIAPPPSVATKSQSSPAKTEDEIERAEESSNEPAVAVESSNGEGQGEEIGGMWGGFWRRQAGS